MKIKSTDSKMVNTKSDILGKGGGITAGHPPFFDVLKESEIEKRKEVCAGILKEIDAQSEELKRSLTLEGVKRYRKLVSEFMKEALNQSYKLNEQTRWDRSGNRKSFITVKKINNSLEELIEAVINQEKKQIDLIAKLDEIRGLLLDLYT